MFLSEQQIALFAFIQQLTYNSQAHADVKLSYEVLLKRLRKISYGRQDGCLLAPRYVATTTTPRCSLCYVHFRYSIQIRSF